MTIENLKRIGVLLVASFAMLATAFGDEAEDEAEFNRLYAEFNELYANSEDLDPIIDVAERLYKLAPKIYGKNSQNTAVVTYNLASLYDEKGGFSSSEDETKAVELYKKYFDILDKLDLPRDKSFIDQLSKYIMAEQNINGYQSDFSIAEEAINSIQNLNILESEKADLIYAIVRIKFDRTAHYTLKPYLEDILSSYEEAYGPDNVKIGLTLYWLAKLELAKYLSDKSFRKYRERSAQKYEFEGDNENVQKATEQYLRALNIFENSEEPNSVSIELTKNALAQLYYDLGQTDTAKNYQKLALTENEKKLAEQVVPVSKFAPQYPPLAKKLLNRKEWNGEVNIEFTIDINGRAKNIIVTNSTNRVFNLFAVEAIRKYLYETQYIDGIATEISGVKAKITFDATGS